MIKIDLHTHSSCSDGTYTPSALVKTAGKRGISVMSLTDHDTVEGISGFLKSCKKYRIGGIAGVELSAEYPGTLHILGYRIDICNEKLLRSLEFIRIKRDERNIRILENLQNLGMKIDMKDIESEAGGNVTGRPHFARVMVRKGYAMDVRSAFENYLARGKTAYEPRTTLRPEECISIINEAGGLAVLAHPSQTTEDNDKLDNLLGELKGMGLWGLECIYPGYSSEAVLKYMKLASKHSLLYTAGTDFHGNKRNPSGMGVPVSEGFLPWARLGISL